MRHENVTGLVLAGGLGTRMGGVDKGLQLWHGRPLVAHVLERLAPQVGPMLINANRNGDAYAAWEHPVVADVLADHPGPLAGFLTGLQACTTEWLVTAPCDSPLLPLELVDQLMAGAARCGAALAMAQTRGKYQPVFCLMRASLASSLQQYLGEGGRKIDRWTLSQGAAVVDFNDPGAFANANTMDDLHSLNDSQHG